MLWADRKETSFVSWLQHSCFVLWGMSKTRLWFVIRSTSLRATFLLLLLQPSSSTLRLQVAPLMSQRSSISNSWSNTLPMTIKQRLLPLFLFFILQSPQILMMKVCGLLRTQLAQSQSIYFNFLYQSLEVDLIIILESSVQQMKLPDLPSEVRSERVARLPNSRLPTKFYKPILLRYSYWSMLKYLRMQQNTLGAQSTKVQQIYFTFFSFFLQIKSLQYLQFMSSTLNVTLYSNLQQCDFRDLRMPSIMFSIMFQFQCPKQTMFCLDVRGWVMFLGAFLCQLSRKELRPVRGREVGREVRGGQGFERRRGSGSWLFFLSYPPPNSLLETLHKESSWLLVPSKNWPTVSFCQPIQSLLKFQQIIVEANQRQLITLLKLSRLPSSPPCFISWVERQCWLQSVEKWLSVLVVSSSSMFCQDYSGLQRGVPLKWLIIYQSWPQTSFRYYSTWSTSIYSFLCYLLLRDSSVSLAVLQMEFKPVVLVVVWLLKQSNQLKYMSYLLRYSLKLMLFFSVIPSFWQIRLIEA